MRKLLFLIILLLNFTMVFGIPTPCTTGELLRTANYALEGYVLDVDCEDKGEVTACIGMPKDVIVNCTANVELTKSLKTNKLIAPDPIGTIIKIPFVKMVERKNDCVPGTFSENFIKNHKIRYYDINQNSCIWNRLTDLGLKCEIEGGYCTNFLNNCKKDYESSGICDNKSSVCCMPIIPSVCNTNIDCNDSNPCTEDFCTGTPKKCENKTITNGCNLENNCVPIGTRGNKQYCDIDSTMKNQKIKQNYCENNFECSSNICVNNNCVESSIIQKIIDWFMNIFGG